MSGDGFWRWFDRGARLDFCWDVVGFIFDWKGWIAGTVAGGGGAMTFLMAAIDGRSPLDVWVLAVVVMAALTVFVYFCILALEKFKKPQTANQLGYLRHEDSELGSAIRDMVWRSAWGKWFNAQCLANNPLRPSSDQLAMHAATHLASARGSNERPIRGAWTKAGQIDYEAIPRTNWRSTGFHMIPDDMSLWKMILIPVGGVEFTPDGKIIGHDMEAVQRTDQLATYDSLIVNARQFEKLWPLKRKDFDAARKQHLKRARKAGADRAEIAKLSRD